MGGGRRPGNGESERNLGQAPAEGQVNQGSQKAWARPAMWGVLEDPGPREVKARGQQNRTTGCGGLSSGSSR